MSITNTESMIASVTLCDRRTLGDDLEKWIKQINDHGRPVSSCQWLQYNPETKLIERNRYMERTDCIWVRTAGHAIYVSPSRHIAQKNFGITVDKRNDEDEDMPREVARWFAAQAIENNLAFFSRQLDFVVNELYMELVDLTVTEAIIKARELDI